MAKKWHKQIQRRLGNLDYDFDPGKTHIKITIRAHGRERKMTVSSSPSCPHAINQFTRDLRKVKKELKEGLDPGAMWAKD